MAWAGDQGANTRASQKESLSQAALFPGFFHLVQVQGQERTPELGCPGLNPGPILSQLCNLEHQPLPAAASSSGNEDMGSPPSEGYVSWGLMETVDVGALQTVPGSLPYKYLFSKINNLLMWVGLPRKGGRKRWWRSGWMSGDRTPDPSADLTAICVALTKSFKESSVKWGPALSPHTVKGWA